MDRSVCATVTSNIADTDSQQCELVFVTARALPSLLVTTDMSGSQKYKQQGLYAYKDCGESTFIGKT